MSILSDAILRYLQASPQDAAVISKGLQQLEDRANASSRQLGPVDSVSRVGGGNFTMQPGEGLRIYNALGKETISLDPSGDLAAGADLSTVSGHSFKVFSVPHGGIGRRSLHTLYEDFGAGDVLLGDNSPGKANLFWDRSTGRLNFRGGITTNAYIDTDGKLVATLGDIGGWNVDATRIYSDANEIVLDSANQRINVGTTNPIVIDGANGLIRSDDYASGYKGWQVEKSGRAEFQDVIVRGELQSSVFAKNLIDARAGTLIVATSGGTLSEDMTVPTLVEIGGGQTWTMTINDPPGGAAFLFANGNTIRAKAQYALGIHDVVFTVSARVDNGDGTQSYTCTWVSGTANFTALAGSPVVDYGVSNDGFLLMTADDADGPFYSVRTWATTVDNVTERLRLGNMRNSYGTGANDRYGIGIGDYSGGNYLSYNAETANQFEIKAGGGSLKIDSTGISIIVPASETVSKSYKFKDASGNDRGLLEAWETAGTLLMKLGLPSVTAKDSFLEIQSLAPSGKSGQITIDAWQGSTSAVINVISGAAAYIELQAGGNSSAFATPDKFRVVQDLYVDRASSTINRIVFSTALTAKSQVKWDDPNSEMTLEIGGTNVLLAKLAGVTIAGLAGVGGAANSNAQLTVYEDGVVPGIRLIHGGSNLFATIRGPDNRDLRFDLVDNGDTDKFDFRNAAGNSVLEIYRTGSIAGLNGDLSTVVWTDYSASSTVVGWSSFTTKHIYYKKVGRLVFCDFQISGTSNSTSVSFTLPFSENHAVGARIIILSRDNGGTREIGFGSFSGSTATLVRNAAGSAWTASGGKEVYGQFWYEATS